MTTRTTHPVALTSDFAGALPLMAVPWQAAQAPEPRLLLLNDDLAATLGLDPTWLRTDDGVRFLLGHHLPPGATPVAQAYAGHQFGGFVPRLGDGRALLLGEIATPSGPSDLHLKGSGRTPFSRGGDGLAAVGPMLREYVIGEAMHALGIPTTRALAVVATGAVVHREEPLPGAVLVRVASSHLRVGSFQYARVHEDPTLLRTLTDYAIARHYPDAAQADVPALALLDAVVHAQAALVAQWMGAGFIHGVMNTDNMTISGETIDYGPCAFMDDFDPATVFSSIDTNGRYAWANQPVIAEWNLSRFAETLLPLIDDDQDTAVAAAVEVLGAFRPTYSAAWGAGLRAKIGAPEADDDLITDLLDQMRESHVDLTGFFRALGSAARGNSEPVRGLMLDLPRCDAWLERWLTHRPDAAALDAVNPVYVPRNHLVDHALSAASDGDLGPVEALLEVLRQPFVVQPGRDQYAAPAPAEFGRTFQTFCGT